MKRRFILKSFIFAAVAASSFAFPAADAYAQWKPTRAIRVIVPFGPGGTSDVIVRAVAAQMEKQTGWQFLVENKTGAAGAIGMQELIRSRPDGYTIGFNATSGISLDPFFPGANVPFTSEDFEYLATTGSIPYGLVAPKDAPYNDLKSMGEFSKTRPLRFLSTGRPLQHAMDMMAQKFGINVVTSNVASAAEAIPQIMGGHADLTIDGGIFANFVKDGRVKLITVLDTKRGTYAPNVPTIIEQGGELPFSNYRVFLGPKNMQPDAMKAIVDALDKAINSDEIKAYHATIYNPVENLGPEGTLKDINTQIAKWKAYYAVKK